MATLVIDTHQFVKGLTKAGVPAAQAEAIAEGFKKINLEHVATKEDIALLRVDIQKVKVEILQWAVPLFVGQIAIFALIVKWLVGGA